MSLAVLCVRPVPSVDTDIDPTWVFWKWGMGAVPEPIHMPSGTAASRLMDTHSPQDGDLAVFAFVSSPVGGTALLSCPIAVLERRQYLGSKPWVVLMWDSKEEGKNRQKANIKVIKGVEGRQEKAADRKRLFRAASLGYRVISPDTRAFVSPMFFS